MSPFFLVIVLSAFASVPLWRAIRALIDGTIIYRGRILKRTARDVDFWLLIGIYISCWLFPVYLLFLVFKGHFNAI